MKGAKASNAKEADMRRTTVATTNAGRSLGLPRGWIIVGLALASWALFAGGGIMLARLFAYVGAAIF